MNFKKGTYKFIWIHHISCFFNQTSTKENFDTLSAMDIAEQLTFLDHKIFISIRSE